MSGSIVLSPDFSHFCYNTPDHKLIIDGFPYGPYATNGQVIFSGDSKTFAYLASEKPDQPSKLYLGGNMKILEHQPTSVFRAGERGELCWIEREKENGKVRLVTPNETSVWVEKIEKIGFSDDGSNFYMRTSEKLAQDKDAQVTNADPLTRDYLIFKGGRKIARDRIMQIFPAPNGAGFASVTADDLVTYKAYANKYFGELYGKPVFSDDGSQFAFRFRRTVRSGTLNVDQAQYCINGTYISDLQIQTGLTFSPDGKRWVMCGSEDKKPFLYTSENGKQSYSDVPGLGLAPGEPYKAVAMANGNWVFLFQARRSKPMLFVEGKSTIELGAFLSVPESMSVSPDGRFLAVAGGDERESRAYVVDLQNPALATDLLKGTYDLQVLGKGTFAWTGDRQLRFLVARKNDLVRVNVQL